MPSEVPPQSPPAPSVPFARHHRQGAFTLVEVTLAIGIVAFAFVAIFGLIPVGMTNFRRALDTSLTTEIAQRIINDIKQSDFDTVAAITPTPGRYFTEQGEEKNMVGDVPEDNLWLYYGEVSVVSSTGTVLPGEPVSANLLTVKIKLGANPGHIPNPFSTDVAHPNPKAPYRVFTTLIARNSAKTPGT